VAILFKGLKWLGKKKKRNACVDLIMKTNEESKKRFQNMQFEVRMV